MSAIQRDERGRLKPGAVLNPKGRPKTGYALAEMIREVAGEPRTMRELVALVLDVAFGRAVRIDPAYTLACADARREGLPPPPPPDTGEVLQPTIAEMQRAWEFLASWGFQKPAQALEITTSAGQPVMDYSKLTPAELDALEASLRKAAGVGEVLEVAAAPGAAQARALPPASE